LSLTPEAFLPMSSGVTNPIGRSGESSGSESGLRQVFGLTMVHLATQTGLSVSRVSRIIATVESAPSHEMPS
jgi:hypothetical protein